MSHVCCLKRFIFADSHLVDSHGTRPKKPPATGTRNLRSLVQMLPASTIKNMYIGGKYVKKMFPYIYICLKIGNAPINKNLS